MTFDTPWRLLLLAIPVALLVGYLLVQRSRRRVSARFTSVELLASVAPRRPGWQRHLATVAVLAALVALVIGFAHPGHDQRVPKQRATIMLALDVSASMSATDVAPSRLVAAEAEARRFVAILPPGLQLGLVSFDSQARVLVAPTSDRSTVLGAINNLQIGQGTATGSAINLSVSTIAAIPRGANGKPAPAAIVLMSDGTPTIGIGDVPPLQAAYDAAAGAKRAGVPIDTIALGTPYGTVAIQGYNLAVPFDPAAMARIAAESGGRTFSAQTGDQLKAVYAQIGRVVGYEVHHRSLAGDFTAAGFALAVIGAVASMLWTQRVL